MNSDRRTRYEAAREAAPLAGQAALRYFDTRVAVEWKQDHSLVTAANREAEALLRQRLLGAFPQDGFLGEESGARAGSSGYRWVIDPVDGTRSFVQGIPIWATLIGLEHQGRPIAGIIHLPVWGQTYRPLEGDGAYLEDRPVRVSDVGTLADSDLYFTGLGWFLRSGWEQRFAELVRRTRRQRGFGHFYGFVLVAQGSGELMIEHGVHPWDVVAVKPIVEEAGGRFRDWQGQPRVDRPDVIASDGKVHDAALDLLRGEVSNGH